MKLKTVTGKESFYQWDTNQYLEAEGLAENQEVHFCRKNDTVALVCKVRGENGKKIVDVPNELLQTGEPITAYVYAMDERDNRTCHTQSFHVLPRVKPADYVYTQTEVLSYQQLDVRLNALEGEGIAHAVAAYLKENPVETGATAEEAAQILKNKEDIAKAVKSVNGKAPDQDGNVSIALPEAVTDAHINSLIDAKLGVIENGAY